MTPIDLCVALNGPHVEMMLPIAMETLDVSKAVLEFFRDNPRYSVLDNVPRSQFGFQKIA